MILNEPVVSLGTLNLFEIVETSVFMILDGGTNYDQTKFLMDQSF